MRSHLIRALVINWTLISLILAQNSAHRRVKRGHEKTFRALLNIYKTNPLKHSRLYQNFSNHLLSARSDKARGAVLNIDSNESTRLKEKKTGAKLQLIESIIRRITTTTISSTIVKNYFDSSTPENFMSPIFSDTLRRKIYDTKDKITQGKVKILVNNIDGRISLYDTEHSFMDNASQISNSSSYEQVRVKSDALVPPDDQAIDLNALDNDENVEVIR